MKYRIAITGLQRFDGYDTGGIEGFNKISPSYSHSVTVCDFLKYCILLLRFASTWYRISFDTLIGEGMNNISA
ncbi:MAG: hypothetical protein IH947_15160 [Bacteroidetes bacterium]|nr:hypothetical protein [Bacteroidota bacterium]